MTCYSAVIKLRESQGDHVISNKNIICTAHRRSDRQKGSICVKKLCTKIILLDRKILSFFSSQRFVQLVWNIQPKKV